MSKGDVVAAVAAEIRLLRSTGLEEVISFPLHSTTLRELKLAVSKSDRLGRIPTTQQRMFHLGKELKSPPGQVLSEILMIQKSGVVHVHATPPKEVVDLADDDDDDDVEEVDDDDDNCVLLVENSAAASTTTAAASASNSKRRRVA